MTDNNYTSDVSKGSTQPICYSVGCDNPATTTVKIPLGQFVCCLIHVCDSCLLKYPIADDINGCDRPHHPKDNEEQKQ
jgi:hypothetical protein